MAQLDVNERVAKLEADDKVLFHYVDEIRSDVKDLRQLTIAVKEIAVGQKGVTEKLDRIDSRLQNVENNPAEDFRHYKRLIMGCLLTTSITAVVTAILSVIFK